MKEFRLTPRQLLTTVSTSAVTGLVIGGIIMAVVWFKFPKTVYYNFDITEKKVEEEWKYKMLSPEVSDYICDLSEQLNIDSDLCVAILLRENPEQNLEATHRNENGTFDLGLFQLNSRSIETVFLKSYWKIDEEFNPFNWKMNVFIALHHIQDLQNTFKVFDDVVMAYNCGTGAVMKGTIPDSTRQYLAAVKNNYSLLKSQNGTEKR